MPSSRSSARGTPMTGSGVAAATMPGQVRRSPGAGDDDAQAPAGGGLGVVEHPARRPVGGDDVRLVRDVELLQRLGGRLHHRPVRVAAHDDADDGLARSVLMRLLSARAGEGERRVDDAVGQVAGGGDRPGAHLGEVVAEGGDVAELAAGALALAVPVQLDVGPVRHEVVDPLVERAGRPSPAPAAAPPSTLAMTTTGAVIAVAPSG